MDKSADIIFVIECIPVDCVARACCTLSLLLDIDVPSPMQQDHHHLPEAPDIVMSARRSQARRP